MHHVLVVDDDENLRELIRVYLHHEKFAVSTAESADHGLHMIRDNHPDIILLDITMPKKDGFEALRAIKGNQETRHIPVIMISSRSDRETLQAAIKGGAIDYIVKPIKEEVLIQKRNRGAHIVDIDRQNNIGAGRIEIDRKGNRCVFKIVNNVDPKMDQQFIEIFNPSFKNITRGSTYIFDLRALPLLSPEQTKIIDSMVLTASIDHPLVLAGRNYLRAITMNLEPDEQVFISEEDLEAYLTLKEKGKAPDGSSSH